MIAVVNGIEVGYDEVGAGMPVLFAHAFPLNRTMWAPNISALVERCRCVAPDFRGCGESTIAPPYSMAQYADDLASLLDVLRIDKAVLVGCSMGGMVAQEFTLTYPERVRSLALVATHCGGREAKLAAPHIAIELFRRADMD